MKAVCIMNVTSFGYVNTNQELATLEKDKEYELEKAFDPKTNLNYYNVLDNGKIITTLSESETKTFFEINI